MEVTKHGSWYEKKVDNKCSKCGCEFTVDVKELTVVNCYHDIITFSIDCPECGKKMLFQS